MKRVMILAAIAFVFGGAFATGLENADCTRLTLSGNGSPKIELTAQKKAAKKTKKTIKKTGEKIKKVVDKTVTKTVNKTTEKVKKIFN